MPMVRRPLVPGQVIAMKRSLVALFTVGLLVVSSLALAGGATAETTIAAATTCSNGVDNTGGLGAICEVTIVNRITASGGSATVTVRECHGAAGDPQAACETRTAVLTEPVTTVTQCNDAINGGGGTLRCSVQVRNEFDGVSPGATATTVNQCVGSGGGITTGCDPFPATTTGATITQCNGSANGGTLVGLTCTATGTEAAALSVKVNQCNGSANGGGALVICSANIENAAVAPSPSAAPSAAPPSATTPPSSTTPPTAMLATTDVPGSGTTPVIFVGILLAALALVAGWLSLRPGPRRITIPRRHR